MTLIMASDGEISVDSDILNGRSNVSSSPEECTRSITQENDSASEIEGNEGGNNVHDSYFNFLSTYFRSMPAVHLLPVALFMAMGVGSTVGVVPALMADRYARLHYGYDGEEMCLSYTNNKPEACQKGASAAQEAAAMMTLVTNILALFCNSVIGSFSDAYGRRLVLVFSTFLSTISPVVLVVMQVLPAMDPFWYYAASCAVGPVNYVSISFTILSDVIPAHYRTPGFGLFIGTYFLGFSGSPSVARWLSCWQVSIFSSVVVILGFMYTVCFLPETLPNHIALHNQSIRARQTTRTLILRPIKELSILNQNMAIRLVAIGTFLSGMVYSTDVTLCVYYFENQMHINVSDLSKMFLLMGVVGIVIQAFLLKFLITLLGEKGLLVTSFISGTFHNLFYGIAQTKYLIFVALCLSQLTKTNFPILSSLASTHATEYQQGSIQGALFALSALANAIGPIILQLVYKATADGTMFVAASALYLIGTMVVAFIPSEKRQETIEPTTTDFDQMEEPLLSLSEGGENPVASNC